MSSKMALEKIIHTIYYIFLIFVFHFKLLFLLCFVLPDLEINDTQYKSLF